MNQLLKKSTCILVLGLFLIPISVSANKVISNEVKTPESKPLLNENIQITFTVKEIRAYDKIDEFSDPDFYVVLKIEGKKVKSPVWMNQKYVKTPWSYTFDAPVNQEFINITIELWDKDPGLDKLCDLTKNENNNRYDRKAFIIYDIKSGHWYGSDYIEPESITYDESGYGRLNGCDDHSYNFNDRDCELRFDITQTDIDGDGIPAWVETNFYNTDPTVNDTGRDDDNDGVPIEWEYKWGHVFSYDHHNDTIISYWFYDPFKWEDHANFDPDEDGLNNIEEYKTSQWGSDPFRQDIFVELDQMVLGPNETGGYYPELAKDMLRDAYGKRNILFQIDDGWMGGGEKTIPFSEPNATFEDLQTYYLEYFLHGDLNNWRRGVFHYGMVLFNASASGFCFPVMVDENITFDSFVLERKYCEHQIYKFRLVNILVLKTLDKQYRKSFIYASATMHENGHILGINRGNTAGCDNQLTYFPWQRSWWKWRHYRSCMNYGFVFQVVDYSDGSHGRNDFDDWARIDLRLFQIPRQF